MSLPETAFLVHIIEGYSFRHIIGIVKSETDYATMVLSPDSIEISFMNRSKCAIHKITFNTKELKTYQYNICDEEGNLIPQYPIAFETNALSNAMSGIGRRDGVRLYWLEGDTKINIQPINSSVKDPSSTGALFVNILNMEYVRYNIPEGYPQEPNVRVVAKDFSSICTRTKTLKCSFLEIFGDSNQVKFTGVQANNSPVFVNIFKSQAQSNSNSNPNPANLDDIDVQLKYLSMNDSQEKETGPAIKLNILKAEDYKNVRVPAETVRALSKIHNISPPGTLIRFFFAEGLPHKIESPIGIYGTYSICVRNPRT